MISSFPKHDSRNFEYNSLAAKIGSLGRINSLKLSILLGLIIETYSI